MTEKRIIGLGTWLDKLAARVIEREKSLGRNLDLIRTEAGIAASGVVHLGSMADSVRAHAVCLAIQNLGYRSETIQFADDMDGLRSVPKEVPTGFDRYLLHPVSLIPDPFSCHESYAEHMENLLIEALKMVDISTTFIRGFEAYQRGTFASQMKQILLNARRIGEKIREITGQDKFLETLPYFPICSSCGRIYTATAHSFDSKSGKAAYKCRGVRLRNVWYEGCGYEGEASISRADGKLSWKTELAARWASLDIRFEAFGKDLASSILVNDWVSREILNYEPPTHVQYELFLDASRRKISKSRGGSVFTPQLWFRYAPPQSLTLLLLKRIKGTRVISHQLIPALINELDRLRNAYLEREGHPKERGLYAYVYNLRPPKEKGMLAPFSLLLQLAEDAPVGDEQSFIEARLRKYGYALNAETYERIGMAIRFTTDFGHVESRAPVLEGRVRSAFAEFAERLADTETAEDIQQLMFNTARKHDLEPSDLFRTVYEALLGQPKGPRLGPYIIDLGKERALARLRQVLEPGAAQNL